MKERGINNLIFLTEACLPHQDTSVKPMKGAQAKLHRADGKREQRGHISAHETPYFAEGKVKIFIHSSLESCHSADEEH